MPDSHIMRSRCGTYIAWPSALSINNGSKDRVSSSSIVPLVLPNGFLYQRGNPEVLDLRALLHCPHALLD